MFRCCQTPIEHGNELDLQTIEFPHDIASRRSRPSTTAHWRQITGVAATTQTPRAALASPTKSTHAIELSLLPVGSVSATSPRKSGSRKSKAHRAQHDVAQKSPTASLPSPADDGHRDFGFESAASLDAADANRDTSPISQLERESSPHPQSISLPPPTTSPLPPPPINILPAPDNSRKATDSSSTSSAASSTSTREVVQPSQSSPSMSPLSPRADFSQNQAAPKNAKATTAVSPGFSRKTDASSGRDTPASVASNPFRMRESAQPTPTTRSRLSTGKAPPPSARSAGSPGGLRTKDRSKMVDLLDAKVKKSVLAACNFVRETIDVDPAEKPEVCDREAAFTLWALIFASQLEAAGKQHPVATACAHIMDHAQGELATNNAKKAAPIVQFFVKAIVRPTLDYLVAPDPNHDSMYVAKDIRDTARVILGERPPGLAQRTPYLESILTRCNYPKLKSLSAADKEDLFQTLISGMEDSRRGGDAYKLAVHKVQNALYT